MRVYRRGRLLNAINYYRNGSVLHSIAIIGDGTIGEVLNDGRIMAQQNFWGKKDSLKT